MDRQKLPFNSCWFGVNYNILYLWQVGCSVGVVLPGLGGAALLALRPPGEVVITAPGVRTRPVASPGLRVTRGQSLLI